MLALTIDALAGTQLLMRSLLGPKPAFGARFYGIGNELKSGLAVLVFAAVAAALYPAVRSRRAASAMACAGIALALVEGSARIGAGVGGVILVSAGTAVASVMLLPGAVNRKRILIVTAAPVAGLVALAALDLLTAHGGGHFTGSVLDARSAGDIRDIIVRRYGAAWDELKNHLMPLATALALGASAYGVRRRERICAPVDSDPAWLAALAGGLTAGVIGALTEDSGPVLLVVAVFALACVLAYLWGRPPTNRLSATISTARARGRSDAHRQLSHSNSIRFVILVLGLILMFSMKKVMMPNMIPSRQSSSSLTRRSTARVWLAFTATAALAGLLASIGLTACGSSSEGKHLTLVAYSTPQAAYAP